MNAIRKLVWDGALNVEVTIDPELVIKGIPKNKTMVNLRIPRDSYIMNYLDYILTRLEAYIRVNLKDLKELNFWFEYDGIPLSWNYPTGVLYDIMNTKDVITAARDTNHLNMWRINLTCGSQVPRNVIPIIEGTKQIEKYWMHQWKQVCFILRGSSKQIMSISRKEGQSFWESILRRDMETFNNISTRIIPKKARFIPVVIHINDKFIQPVAPSLNDDGIENKVINITEGLSSSEIAIISHGVVIPKKSSLKEVYDRFLSFDGFLHLIIQEQPANT
ncbi:Atg5p NDAI_0E02370 [Naumovozyma dairenensis CBS 421]|uniref:Autophagy protein 5 n=1 Tax=Naumovozyma dairenensis (strain ATCC 10597 / BCRC 20456 / CBS 421 / NBRC 0211 / NRRL Y-12639) TaxID=1071378 RepID=G0WBD4_NAUDC|nr:hypothetical protein NDAI_0E02370 [Naumovozyma dairenensis CBS 421]CCD25054.1 hypothetical protein NDAI_0E02370 [Naumovozyma dairenensis CBS 421]